MTRSPSHLSLDGVEDNYSCTEEPEAFHTNECNHPSVEPKSLNPNERNNASVEPNSHDAIQTNKSSIEPVSIVEMGPGDLEETEPGWIDAAKNPRFQVVPPESRVRDPKANYPFDRTQIRGRTIYTPNGDDHPANPPQPQQGPRPLEDYYTKAADGSIVWATTEEEETTPPTPKETPRETPKATPREILWWINSLIDYHRETFPGYTAEQENELWAEFSTIDTRCEMCKRRAKNVYELQLHLDSCDWKRTGGLAMDKKRRIRWTNIERSSDVWYGKRCIICGDNCCGQ